MQYRQAFSTSEKQIILDSLKGTDTGTAVHSLITPPILMSPHGRWAQELNILPVGHLRQIFRRSAPPYLVTAQSLKSKQSLIDSCCKLPVDSECRIALNAAVSKRAEQESTRRQEKESSKRKRKADRTSSRRLAREEVCSAMYHDSIGDISMFMETPTPSEVRTHHTRQTFC
jgi:hypothetical protein